MMQLAHECGISDPDDFYQELIDSQREMNEDQSALMNAKLVLILCNHIGDRAVLSEAITLAAGAGTEPNNSAGRAEH